jgi:hypothetical protein
VAADSIRHASSKINKSLADEIRRHEIGTIKTGQSPFLHGLPMSWSLYPLREMKCLLPDDEKMAAQDSPFLAPKRHPISFVIIFLPVVASVVAASMIHEFSFFYILIPGIWCYGVGGSILNGLFSGKMNDTHGAAVRASSPFRFWGKIGIWSLFYLTAAAYPIGFALQESAKQKPNSGQGVAPKSTVPASLQSTSAVPGSEE